MLHENPFSKAYPRDMLKFSILVLIPFLQHRLTTGTMIELKLSVAFTGVPSTWKSQILFGASGLEVSGQ